MSELEPQAERKTGVILGALYQELGIESNLSDVQEQGVPIPECVLRDGSMGFSGNTSVTEQVRIHGEEWQSFQRRDLLVIRYHSPEKYKEIVSRINGLLDGLVEDFGPALDLVLNAIDMEEVLNPVTRFGWENEALRAQIGVFAYLVRYAELKTGIPTWTTISREVVQIRGSLNEATDERLLERTRNFPHPSSELQYAISVPVCRELEPPEGPNIIGMLASIAEAVQATRDPNMPRKVEVVLNVNNDPNDTISKNQNLATMRMIQVLQVSPLKALDEIREYLRPGSEMAILYALQRISAVLKRGMQINAIDCTDGAFIARREEDEFASVLTPNQSVRRRLGMLAEKARFAQIGRENGQHIFLDADEELSHDYFVKLESVLAINPELRDRVLEGNRVFIEPAEVKLGIARNTEIYYLVKDLAYLSEYIEDRKKYGTTKRVLWQIMARLRISMMKPPGTFVVSKRVPTLGIYVFPDRHLVNAFAIEELQSNLGEDGRCVAAAIKSSGRPEAMVDLRVKIKDRRRKGLSFSGDRDQIEVEGLAFEDPSLAKRAFGAESPYSVPEELRRRLLAMARTEAERKILEISQISGNDSARDILRAIVLIARVVSTCEVRQKYPNFERVFIDIANELGRKEVIMYTGPVVAGV